MNLTEWLDRTASSWPRKAAIIEGPQCVPYAGLVDRISVLAAQLQALGVGPGSRVGLCYPNSATYIALTFALWRLGAVVVPIPAECPEEEVAEINRVLRVEAFLRRRAPTPGEPLGWDFEFTRLSPRERPNNHGLNIAFIRFTSGTTHARKGVVLCHETVRERVLAANRALQIGPADTVMWSLPMSHHFLVTIVLYLMHGATLVLARHTLARPFLETAQRCQATVLYAAPFQFSLLARDDSGITLPSVRLAVSTTCALTQDVAEDFFKRFGCPLSQALGIIELGLVSLNTEDPRGRWDSVGRPLGDFQVRVLAPDDSGCGEVAVRGPGFLDAYAAPWMPRGEVLDHGWFATGDLGRMDADGFLFLVGRKSAVINLAGRKVFPEEIEAVLNRHPAVRESRVYARRHAQLGEVVEADVVLARQDTDPEDVREFCRAHLACFKVPTRFHIVSALPRTAATGKIRRTAVAAAS